MKNYAGIAKATIFLKKLLKTVFHCTNCTDDRCNCYQNSQGILPSQWSRLFTGLSRNIHVESLSAANCDVGDGQAEDIAACLRANGTMKSVTLDSNRLGSAAVLALIKATAERATLEELRLSNQVIVDTHFRPRHKRHLNVSGVRRAVGVFPI